MGRWGTYYSKTYENWRKTSAAALEKLTGEPHAGPLFVATVHVVSRPAKPSNPFPSPDLDNYLKAAWDSVTKSQLIWVDDKQLTHALPVKRWARKGEHPHVYFWVCSDPELLNITVSRNGEDVFDLGPDAIVGGLT